MCARGVLSAAACAIFGRVRGNGGLHGRRCAMVTGLRMRLGARWRSGTARLCGCVVGQRLTGSWLHVESSGLNGDGFMTRFRLLLAMMFLAGCVAAAPPVTDGTALVNGLVSAPFADEAAQDQAFLDWRAELLAAIADRDAQAVSQMAAPEIKLTFGGEAGRAALMQRLTGPSLPNGPEQGEDYWQALEAAVIGGGRFDAAGTFAAPYFWRADIPGAWNVFDTFFVVGPPRPVYAAPATDMPVLMTLQEVGFEAPPYPGVPRVNGVDQFRAVSLKNGEIGFMAAADLQPLVGYRATFEKRDGVWQMIYFIAGD